MSQTTQATSELRQRMIEDMRMRKLCDKTQASYIRAVRKFAGYLGRSPHSAGVEDLRNFQLHLVDHGVSPITLNATITGLNWQCWMSARPGQSHETQAKPSRCSR